MSEKINVVDEYLRRYLRIVRVSEGESLENIQLIEKANEKISELFEKTFSKKRVTRADLNALRVNVDNIITLTYSKRIMDKVSKDIDDLINMEFDWHKKTYEKLGFAERFLNPSQEIIVQDALNRKFQGKTFKQWFDNLGSLHSDKIGKLIKAGAVTGTTTEQIVRSIMDISQLPKHHVRTLTRSALMSAANDVKSAFFVENPDLYDGKIWLSTLDYRTTPFICGPRDQKKYTQNDEPIDHDLPWEEGPGRIHFNCRSTWIPIIEGFEITAHRAAIGAGDSYDRGDKYTRTGRVRKTTKNSRDRGIFEIEQVSGQTAYEDWLRTQPKDYLSDVFGSAESADLFKDGASLSEVHQNRFGAPLRLASL